MQCSLVGAQRTQMLIDDGAEFNGESALFFIKFFAKDDSKKEPDSIGVEANPAAIKVRCSVLLALVIQDRMAEFLLESWKTGM